MAQEFFPQVKGRIPFGGIGSDDPLAFKIYEPDRIVLGKRMEDHLRVAVCYWHSFNWPGSDVFGVGTFDRPWLAPSMEPMAAARLKLSAAFEFFEKLGTPFYTFHDRDMAPDGARADTHDMRQRCLGGGGMGAGAATSADGDRLTNAKPAATASVTSAARPNDLFIGFLS